MAIFVALATIGLKAGAYLVTGSVGLLSDAAESVVNLVAAIVALVALKVSSRPADESHHFGHAKAEYFSAAVEGGMIVVAACFIVVAAAQRFLEPQPLENVGVGLAVSILASVLNGVTAVVLVRAGRKHRSLTLVADGKHLMTDVWTSVGVVGGVMLVGLTGWERLDPVVAMAVGVNIIVTGYQLLHSSVDGLMDRSWPAEENTRFAGIFSEFTSEKVKFHALRTREAGHQRFAEVHVLVPGEWTVQRGHNLVEEVETRIHRDFPDVQIICHLEPLEDPRSYDDYPTEVAIAEREGGSDPRCPTAG
ncbi:cation diffusion facilitator family transporter [Austwickia chelonae]|uniref:Putative cation efflux protein n=1 Tax=Austwickia chelonae NBRC 105200 TaxID=1184607 RepID=K6VQ05_9MICO|nr:cation diffusion facilitator family transporter [Austwickia chelonae]GAB77455.1 putative cation efflux protein [Austwickia chelonae NBRC 105200]